MPEAANGELPTWILVVLVASLLCLGSTCGAELPVPGIAKQLQAACRAMVSGEIPEAQDVYGHALASVMHLSKALGIQFSACTVADDGWQFELAFRRREAFLALGCSLSGGYGYKNVTEFQMECVFPGTQLLKEDETVMARSIMDIACHLLLTNKMPLGNNVFTQMRNRQLMETYAMRFTRCVVNDDNDLEISMESHGIHFCDVTMTLVGSFGFYISCEIPQELDDKFRRSARRTDWWTSGNDEL